MKANKTHISLETAKLLKDCGVESKYIIQQSIAGCYQGSNYPKSGGFYLLPREKAQLKLEYSYPAYTWQEILWENAVEFFGKYPKGYNSIFTKAEEATSKILCLLQQKNYEKADKYFRNTTILITQSKND